MGQMTIVMPPLSIARELWRYGEPELAGRALELTAEEALDIGERAGEMTLAGSREVLWPNGPRSRSCEVLLAATEHFEGTPRPCSRTRRLAEKDLPRELQATEAELWEASAPLSAALTQRHLASGAAAGRKKR